MVDRRIHAKINLSFGDGRLNLDFDPANRLWNIEDEEDQEMNERDN